MCWWPGGELIFTDPMAADDVPDGVLQPVYDRLNLRDLARCASMREAAQQLGFEARPKRPGSQSADSTTAECSRNLELGVLN